LHKFRLLDTDNRVVLPINSPIRIIVTAADVLHSFMNSTKTWSKNRCHTRTTKPNQLLN